MSTLPGWATFPNPVNEKAARTVAAGVALLTVVALVVGATSSVAQLWLTVLLLVGFAARTLAGPRFSLLGRLATQVIAPRLGPAKPVPGPPKRFAQSIGLVLTAVAAVAGLAGVPVVTTALLAVLLVFATLESVLGFCAGCRIFGLLMKAGVIPADTCADCNDIWARYGRTSA